MKYLRRIFSGMSKKDTKFILAVVIIYLVINLIGIPHFFGVDIYIVEKFFILSLVCHCGFCAVVLCKLFNKGLDLLTEKIHSVNE